MPDLKIVVQSPQRPVRFCPVSIDLEMGTEEAEKMALVDQWTSLPVPTQVEAAEGGCRLHWMINSAATGQEMVYHLTKAVKPGTHSRVDLIDEGHEEIAVKVGGNVLTRYRYSPNEARPALYPVRGPFGEGITRGFPFEDIEGDDRDHKHHRSLYWAWGDVNGVDCWSEEEGHGCIRHRAFDAVAGGPVFGYIKSTNDWVDAQERKLMEDRVTLRFYNTPSSECMIDFEVKLVASEGDVKLGDTKEGGICSVRVASTMNASKAGIIRNSFGGTNEAETWGKRASWCDYVGPVAGKLVGIAVFDHPGNFRYPTYWHVRNYGLMTANPFGLSHFLTPRHADGTHTIKAGEELAFRYRVYVHAGTTASANVRERYLEWVYPAAAEVA